MSSRTTELGEMEDEIARQQMKNAQEVKQLLLSKGYNDVSFSNIEQMADVLILWVNSGYMRIVSSSRLNCLRLGIMGKNKVNLGDFRNLYGWNELLFLTLLLQCCKCVDIPWIARAAY